MKSCFFTHVDIFESLEEDYGLEIVMANTADGKLFLFVISSVTMVQIFQRRVLYGTVHTTTVL